MVIGVLWAYASYGEVDAGSASYVTKLVDETLGAAVSLVEGWAYDYCVGV